MLCVGSAIDSLNRSCGRAPFPGPGGWEDPLRRVRSTKGGHVARTRRRGHAMVMPGALKILS